MHLRCKLFKLGALLSEVILNLQELLAELCILLVPQIDQVDIVLVLEAQIVKSSLQIRNVYAGLAL